MHSRRTFLASLLAFGSAVALNPSRALSSLVAPVLPATGGIVSAPTWMLADELDHALYREGLCGRADLWLALHRRRLT